VIGAPDGGHVELQQRGELLILMCTSRLGPKQVQQAPEGRSFLQVVGPSSSRLCLTHVNMAASGATLRVHDLASKQPHFDIVRLTCGTQNKVGGRSVYPNHRYQQQQTGNNDYCWDRIEPMNAKAEHSSARHWKTRIRNDGSYDDGQRAHRRHAGFPPRGAPRKCLAAMWCVTRTGRL